MVDQSAKFITEIEKHNLSKTLDKIDNGENPYSDHSKLPKLPAKGNEVKVKSKELTSKQRLDKFNGVVGKHQWTIVEGKEEVEIPKGLRCIACDDNVEVIKSTYGRIIVDYLKKIIEGTKLVINDDTGGSKVVDFRKEMRFPVYQTGFVCKSCLDYLYAQKYVDSEGTTKHAIELMDRKLPIAAPMRPKRDDSMDRGKGEVISVTNVILERGEIIEEWTTSMPKAPQEPVDVRAYNHFSSKKGGLRR